MPSECGDELGEIRNGGVQRPGHAHLRPLIVGNDFPLVIETVSQVRSEVGPPLEARPRHSKSVEICLGQCAEIQSQTGFPPTVLDNELQQAHSLAGVTVARAWIEMDAQLLVRLDEPEVRKARRV